MTEDDPDRTHVLRSIALTVADTILFYSQLPDADREAVRPMLATVGDVVAPVSDFTHEQEVYVLGVVQSLHRLMQDLAAKHTQTREDTPCSTPPDVTPPPSRRASGWSSTTSQANSRPWQARSPRTPNAFWLWYPTARN